MKRYQRILVPVDFSECSNAAVAEALALARMSHGRLTLLHVLPPPMYIPLDQAIFGSKAGHSVETHLRQKGQSMLDGLIAGLDETERKQCRTELRLGVPWERIVDSSTTHDLIVIGSHGKTGLSRAMLGSVSERVVRHAKCSVLVVRG